MTLPALQTAAETHMIEMFGVANMLMQHASRTTLTPSDLQEAVNIITLPL